MKNVFVIGAGASVDFWFPTGDGLIEIIAGLCRDIADYSRSRNQEDREHVRNFFLAHSQKEYGRTDAQGALTEAATKVKKSIWLSKSIDNYLKEQRSESTTMFGKLLIIAAILRAERKHVVEKRWRDIPLWSQYQDGGIDFQDFAIVGWFHFLDH